MTNQPNNNNSDPVDHSYIRKAAVACFIGNFTEWFDYASYGYLAAVIGMVFFPDADPTAQLLSSFAIFAVSFIFRPIGAIFWGYLGDRKGRRWALSWSILLMAGSTFCIGLLPTYQVIGLFSAGLLLILRMVQGFSAAGEYAGAAIFLAESSPASKRGLYTSIVPASTATGLLTGSIVVTVLFAFLSDPQMQSWGWRIPFLIAGPLGFIGHYIRMHLEDTPEYQRFTEKQKRSNQKHTPLRQLFLHYPKNVFSTFAVASLNAVAFYMILSYLPTYLSQELGYTPVESNVSGSIMLAVYIIIIFLMGHISDSVGRFKMLITASICFIFLTVPFFSLMRFGSIITVTLVAIAFSTILTINDSTLPTFLSEAFPTQVRYTGFALSFNGANAIFGGTAPFVLTWLIAQSKNVLAPAFYLCVVACFALVGMLYARHEIHLEGED